MKTVSGGFLISAVLYGLLGLIFGLHMAISHDHAQMPTHAHVMVIGWLSFAVFGLVYHQFQESFPLTLAKIHFWLAQVSIIGLIVGLWQLYSGNTEFEPLAAVSAIVYAISFVVFAVALIGVVRKQ
ncbi:MAG: hypothetical protein ACR2O3_15570 [Rhizobiaceae bacterium]